MSTQRDLDDAVMLIRRLLAHPRSEMVRDLAKDWLRRKGLEGKPYRRTR